MTIEDKPLKRETAIRRLFAEGLKCCPDNLQEFKSSMLGRWGDPAGIANAGFFEYCRDLEDCLDVKYVVGYTILVIGNVINQCKKDIREILSLKEEDIFRELETMLQKLDNYRCPEDCKKILQLLDEIINKYIFPPEFYKNSSITILGCCEGIR